jgi:hypothetical protein
LRVFDDFLLHRMGDTISAKNHQKLSIYQHIRHSRYDSTAFSRLNIKVFGNHSAQLKKKPYLARLGRLPLGSIHGAQA